MNLHMNPNFHPSERSFVDKAAEWVANASQLHVVKLTDFLDPRQCFIVNSLANRERDVTCAFNGGYDGAERQRALIAPSYKVLELADMNIQVLSITSSDPKLLSLDHGDYMGAILNLGVKRDKVGDLFVSELGCHCLIAAEIIDFFSAQLQHVHRVHVQTDIIPLDQLYIKPSTLQEMELSVSSMRLDGIAGDVHRLSRAKILLPIKAGKCRVNWKPEENPSKLLKEGDMVSIQGLGRFRVEQQGEITKKGKIRLKVIKFV